MQVSEAKQLKYGQQVHCPADRGEPAFVGTVTSEGLDTAPVHKYPDLEFIWIEVMRPGRHKSVWPSNRLGKV